MTDQELEAIRKRAEAATEGPWRIGKQSPNGLNNIGTLGGLMTAQTTNASNADFIAHAREDIPKLLERVQELEEQVDTLHQLQETFREINIRKTEALEFYADRDNHHPTEQAVFRGTEIVGYSKVGPSEVVKDFGDKARQALRGESE